MTVLLLPSGNTAQITGLAPSTYLSTLSAEESAAAATKLSASLPIGQTLAQQLQIQKNVALPDDILELLSQLPAEGKKKAKKAKKAAAKTEA